MGKSAGSKKKKITIGDFLYSDQIMLAYKLKTAKKICEEIIFPNIEEINFKLGQENEPMYLAYAVEFAISRGGK